ncbi:MAG: hypothetical protein ABWX90_03625 [Candidatus Saccharimonadales bacterium]
MTHTIRLSAQWTLSIIIGVCLLALFVFARPASAINQIPTPTPVPGSYGLEATKTQPPPTQGATITTPGNGASFTSSPITVNGICPNDLLVQIYNNGVMVGSVMCKGGSFSLQVSLFAGTNDLTAIVYDDLDQAGPTSGVTTVTYTDTRFTAFGASITLTSSYGRRSAAAGTVLGWPLQLSGGTGPYAFSTDWGDGGAPELKSQALAGVVTLTHAYKKAGIYQVNIKVTDVNGVTAFLQVIAVSNGKVDAASSSTGGSTDDTDTPVKVLWIPAAVSMVLLVPAFWLGRLSQLTSLRNKMLKERGDDTQK